MDWMELARTRLGWVDPRIMAALERGLRRLPAVRTMIEKEYAGILPEMETSLKPYRDEFVANRAIPAVGRDRADILREMTALQAREQERWDRGFVSGAVYHGRADHVEFLNQVYALNSQTNPLHADVWPSIARYEAEVVAMTASMLGASQGQPDDAQAICGTFVAGLQTRNDHRPLRLLHHVARRSNQGRLMRRQLHAWSGLHR